eukprot:426430_1
MLPVALLFVATVRSQSTDPTSTTDKLCLTSSALSDIEGTYEYFQWDTNNNAPIYYNKEANQYLYPWFYSSTNRYYLISSDYTHNAVSAYCHFPSTSTIFDPNECLNENGNRWLIANPVFVTDSTLRLVNCNDICVQGSDVTESNGVYTWLHFNTTRQTSVYESQNTGRYVYGWIYDFGHIWEIGTNYNNAASYSYCDTGLQDNSYVFNLDDSCTWFSYGYFGTDGTLDWFQDNDMEVKKCSDLNCYEYDINYIVNASNQFDTIHDTSTANQCQVLCQNQDGCLYWTWTTAEFSSWANKCHLKKSKGTTETLSNVVSGPRICNSSNPDSAFPTTIPTMVPTALNTRQTVFYGANGINHEHINQGKISGVASWGTF